MKIYESKRKSYSTNISYTIDRIDAENVTCFGSVRRLCAEDYRIVDFPVLHFGVHCKEESHMILITGAGGYIGRHLVERLVARGERPRCLVRNIQRATIILPTVKVEIVKGVTHQPASLTAA